MRTLTLLILLFFTLAAQAADYAREKKWADEITPGIVTGDAVYLEADKHEFLTLYTEVPNAKGAVIVVHGLGVHPDWNLIGVLRNGLADAGYTTLSVQMPVLANDAKPEDYPSTFPEAAQRLAAAVDFLHAKGYKKIAFVSHSMGSRMTDHYLAHCSRACPAAWVAIGLSGNFSKGKTFTFPVLDLYGQNDLPAVLKSAKARAAALKAVPGARQIAAPAADHFFNNKDKELVDYVKEFLDRAGSW